MHPAGRLLTTPFVLVILAEFGICIAIGMLLPVLPLYADGPLGTGSLGVGLSVAATSPTLMLVQPLAGSFGDRRGRRILLVSGALIAAGSIAAYTVADTLWLLVAFRLLTGIGEALIFVGAVTVVTDLAPEERRGEAISLYSLGLWVGLAVGPFMGEAILDDDRFDAVWLTAAGFALVAALLALGVPETRPAAAVAEASARRRLVHPAAFRPGVVLVASVFGFAGFSAFVSLYARDIGLSGSGAVFFLFAAVVVGIRIVGRRIPDRLGAKRASGSALVLLALGLLTIGLWNEPAGLFLGTAVFASGQALAFPALLMLAVGGSTDAERSSVVGTFTAFADIGFSLGALTLGAVASLGGYDAVFLVCACSSVVGGLLLARIPQPARVRTADAS